MKKILLAITCLASAPWAFGSVGVDRDKDGYEDGEAISAYLIYYKTESPAEGPVILRRQALPQEEFEVIPEDRERIRILRRPNLTAPNHR